MRLGRSFKKTAIGAIVLAVVLIIVLGVAKYMHHNTIEANYGKAISTALNTTPPVTCPPGYPLYETAYVTPYLTRAKEAFADLVAAHPALPNGEQVPNGQIQANIAAAEEELRNGLTRLAYMHADDALGDIAIEQDIIALPTSTSQDWPTSSYFTSQLTQLANSMASMDEFAQSIQRIDSNIDTEDEFWTAVGVQETGGCTVPGTWGHNQYSDVGGYLGEAVNMYKYGFRAAALEDLARVQGFLWASQDEGLADLPFSLEASSHDLSAGQAVLAARAQAYEYAAQIAEEVQKTDPRSAKAQYLRDRLCEGLATLAKDDNLLSAAAVAKDPVEVATPVFYQYFATAVGFRQLVDLITLVDRTFGDTGQP